MKTIAIGERWYAEDTTVMTEGDVRVIDTTSGDDRMEYEEAVELATHIATLHNAIMDRGDKCRNTMLVDGKRIGNEARKYIARVFGYWASGDTARAAQNGIKRESGKAYRSFKTRDTSRVTGFVSVDVVNGAITATAIETVEAYEDGKRVDS